MNNTFLRSLGGLRSSVPRLAAPATSTLAPAASRLRLQHANWFNTSAPVAEQPSLAKAQSSNPSDVSISAPSLPPNPQTESAPSSVPDLLPLLAAQPKHYITVHIHGKPYLVTPGDSVRLPFKMPGVLPGDTLRLDRATTIGSRDFTLQGKPYVSTDLFRCRATVIGTDSEPIRLKVVKKRRTRRAKTIKSKHFYTTIRISELKILLPEEPAPKPASAPGYSDTGIVWS
ncbi:hypothetical protein MCOR25_005471 [Pyricularia grisea]|uniref:Large ribosomal subunit protein bL21m n=1 Tax=Pyricularia grisea TaxID=148305 RepID=A0A6P8BBE0_PYRGI|nr:uncharacterized protein PgNI_04989 [Pyricularia grisea]KAI6365177.1 hypothetical protein MCOR25_005471 [Pyricularia grisea]TLD13012.1 hypothetical protein PgNI_04989 [Pyricularia grisea]